MKLLASIVFTFLLIMSCTSKRCTLLDYKQEFNEHDFGIMVTAVLDTILTSMILNADNYKLAGDENPDSLFINRSIMWTQFLYYGITNENALYPTMNLSLLDNDLQNNRPIYFYRTVGDELWDQKKLFCTFYQPVIYDKYVVGIMVKRWYMGFTWDYVYTFQKKSKVWQLSNISKTLTQYSAIRPPDHLFQEMSEKEREILNEKIRNLPVLRNFQKITDYHY